MKYIITLLTCIAWFSIHAQDETEIRLLEHVNHLRDSLGLSPLKPDPVLSEAAADHAFYMKEEDLLTHFQLTFGKETPSERVAIYHGNRTYVGENVALVPLHMHDKTTDSQALADSLFKAWFNSPEHYANMVDPRYTRMGLAYRADGKRAWAAQVFSSEEIVLPKYFQNPDLAWGVRPSEFTCKDEMHTYETMFFANHVEIVGDEIYFYFHDREFFDKVFRDPNDGMAVDIVLREQFPCNRENQLHISRIYDGEMQRPVYRDDLNRNNISGNPEKIRVKIGEVPPYLRNRKWQPSIIVIDNNHLCDYAYPVEVPSDIYPLLYIAPYYSSEADSFAEVEQVRIRDSLHLELAYERSRKQFMPLNEVEGYRFFNEWGPFVAQVNIDCYASVEGPRWLNEKLIAERIHTVNQLLMQYGFDSTKANMRGEENWELMNRQVVRYKLAELDGLSKDEVRTYLRRHGSPFIDSLLFEQRITHIRAYTDTLLVVNSFENYLFASNYDGPDISRLPWNKILREQYILPEERIPNELLDSLADLQTIRTNLLGAASVKDVSARTDSLLAERLLDISKLDRNDPKQVFNYAHFLTQYWFSNFAYDYRTEGVARTISPNELFPLLEVCDSTLAETNLLRIRVNVLLSGIHYYTAHNGWQEVDNYFDRIVDLVRLEGFSPQEAMELALFCNYFHKFKQAVEILEPFHDEGLLSEDACFVLAKTATLIRDQLDESAYHRYMETAKTRNRMRYCQWLNNSFQIQRDEYLKTDYCESCR